MKLIETFNYIYKMITYNKITDVHAEIILNDIKIGFIEKHSKYFTLEISYVRLDLKHSKRKLIGTLAEKIYKRLEALKKPKAKLPVSLLATGNYQILD